MDSSNKNLRKVRGRTFVAIGLAAGIFASLGYLFIEISRQSSEFGEIKSNYTQYVKSLNEAENQFRSQQQALAELRASVTNQRAALAEVEADLTNKTILHDQLVRRYEGLIQQTQTEDAKLRNLRVDQTELQNVKVQLSNATLAYANLIAKKDRLEADLVQQQSKWSDASAQLKTLKKNVSEFLVKEANLQAQVNKQNADLAVMNQDNTELENLAAQSEARLTQANSDLSNVRASLNSEKPELEKARADLSGLQTLASGILEVNTKLRAQIEVKRLLIKELDSVLDQGSSKEK